jgi:DNA (cytosine-5)-methyltransferase 1
MRYLSLFSGIGGFELGIQRAYDMQPKDEQLQMESSISGDNSNVLQRTASCIGYSEIDKYAIKVYERQFNEHPNYGDITAINAAELPDFDLLVGGFPCQTFSVAGKRAGFDDTRGTLFFDIARILKEKQPRHLVLENVKGLLSHDQGRTFTTIIGVLSDLGYSVEWQVLNSKNFGVPQNRERVFIVGHLGNECGRKVFPIISTNSQDITQLNQPKHSNDRVYGTDGVSPTLNTMQGGNRQPFIEQQPRIRRLTPAECERLQGFPDNWTALGIGEEPISDSQRYKMCGNAVTTNVVQAVMKELFAHENN